MPYQYLPNELILQIAAVGLEDPCDLNAFIQTEKRTHTLLQPLLKRRYENSFHRTDEPTPESALVQLGDILITACLNGWERLARLALWKGASVWRLDVTAKRNSPRWPEPFVAATMAGSQKLVELLLEYGAGQKYSRKLEGIRTFYSCPDSPLRTAASRGFLAVMRWIVEEHPVHQNPVQDYPELLGVLEQLLKRGAEPCFYPVPGFNPLLEVAAQSHEIVELILKHGGFRCLDYGSTEFIRGCDFADSALHLCMSCEKCPSRSTHRNDNEPEPKCTPWVNLKSMAVVLKAGSRIDSRNSLGQTALHAAATLGLVGAVELLLRNGANLRLKDIEGCSARDRALQNGYWAVVRLLERFENGDSGGGVVERGSSEASREDRSSVNTREVRSASCGRWWSWFCSWFCLC
jgi:hypothetical protein